MKYLLESHFRGEAFTPARGDWIRPLNESSGRLLFCGMFKGKWILAEENTSPLESSAFDIRISRPFKSYRLEQGDQKLAASLHGTAVSRPVLGSHISTRGHRGLYLRSDGNLGMHHKVAIPLTLENQDSVLSRDVDRVVRVGDDYYAVMFVLGETLDHVYFPEPEDVELASCVCEAPAERFR